jgi:hypothetical protein
LRFAVRPAARPASPRGHRPPGDPSAPRAGHVVRAAGSVAPPGDEVSVRVPYARPADPGPATAGPSAGRATLARALLTPVATDLAPAGARRAMPPTVPVGLLTGTGTVSPAPLCPSPGWAAGPVPARPVEPPYAVETAGGGPGSAGYGVETTGGGRPVLGWAGYGVETAGGGLPVPSTAGHVGEAAASGPLGLGLSSLPERTAVPADGSGEEVLSPTRVMSGRPATAADVARLGETTDRLLLRRLRDGRSPSPATRDTPRRERRPLPGPRAGALTPRAR